MLEYKARQRLDRLSVIIGCEQNVVDQLNALKMETTALMEKLDPLVAKQSELVERLKDIQRAKAEAAAIKSAPDISTPD